MTGICLCKQDAWVHARSEYEQALTAYRRGETERAPLAPSITLGFPKPQAICMSKVRGPDWNDLETVGQTMWWIREGIEIQKRRERGEIQHPNGPLIDDDCAETEDVWIPDDPSL